VASNPAFKKALPSLIGGNDVSIVVPARSHEMSKVTDPDDTVRFMLKDGSFPMHGRVSA